MLWKSAKITQNSTPTEAQQAQALWQLMHDRHETAKTGGERESAPPNQSMNQTASETATTRELAELVDVSQAVRESLNDASLQAEQEIDSRRAFAAIHARLMDAIAASRDAAPVSKAISSPTARAATEAHLAPQKISLSVGAHMNGEAGPNDERRHEAARRSSSGATSRMWPGRLLWPDAKWRVGLALLLASAVGFGGHALGRARAGRELPVQSLADDFDAGLHSSTPFEFVADDSQNERVASQRLSRQMGLPVRLRLARQSGVRLLGARRHSLWNRPGVQTHYIKNGVQVALYQIREPRCSLNDLDETEIDGRLYLTGVRGAYRIVAWRAGDNVMTLVSPLAMKDALHLARDLRGPETPAEITF